MITTILFLLLAPAAESATATRLENKLLWKEWYLFSVAGVPQGYFEEVAENRPGEKQIAITQKWVEKDGGKTETYIGSVASDDGKLTPVAFFSERKGAKVYKIDGRVKAGKLEMTFKPIKPKGKNGRKSVAVDDNVLLSNFVPMKLASHNPNEGSFNFSAVVEDAKDGNFDSRTGSALVFGITKEIRGNTCRKSVVEFEGVAAEWWVTKEGKLCDLTNASQKYRLELSSEKEAKKALGI